MRAVYVSRARVTGCFPWTDARFKSAQPDLVDDKLACRSYQHAHSCCGSRRQLHRSRQPHPREQQRKSMMSSGSLSAQKLTRFLQALYYAEQSYLSSKSMVAKESKDTD